MAGNIKQVGYLAFLVLNVVLIFYLWKQPIVEIMVP